MRFHLGGVPEDFEPDASWRPIREPGPILLQVIATPIGLVCMAGAIAAWLAISELPSARSLAAEPLRSLLFLALLLLSFPVLIVVHELLHAVVQPGLGVSRATVLGVWPTRLLFYAHYAGFLTRNRFLAIFVTPFLVLTVLPLAVAALGLMPARLHFWAAWCSVWNALCACGDLVGMALVFFQVPRRAIVRNRGWRTYWRPLALSPGVPPGNLERPAAGN